MADLRLDARLRCSALIRRPPASSGRAPARRIRASDQDIWRAGVARVAFRLHLLEAMGKSGGDAAGIKLGGTRDARMNMLGHRAV